jgi:hypothetical protein
MTAASGVPRFEHDPITGESLGLEIEEQRTNLLTYSSEFDNAFWVKAQTNVMENAANAPDGTLTADLVSPTAVLLNHGVFRGTPVSAGVHTLSVYAKAQGASKVLLYGGASGYGFDLANGTMSAVTGISAPQAYSITAVGNGWYRCSITVTTAPTEATFLILETFASTSYTGNVNKGIYIWGAQLEAGAFPTSYIPTTTAQVTRAADNAVMTGANFTSWYNPSAGTINAEFDVATTVGDFGMAVFSIAATSSNGYLLYKGSNQAGLFAYIDNNQSATLGNLIANTLAKATLAYNGVSNVGNLNGAAPLSVPTTAVNLPTQLYIGSSFYGTRFSGRIKKLTYYPQRLSNAELVEITA